MRNAALRIEAGVAVVGAVASTAALLSVFARWPAASSMPVVAFGATVLAAALTGALAFAGVQRRLRSRLVQRGLPEAEVGRALAANAWSLSAFLLLLLGASGASLPAVALLALLACVLVRAFVHAAQKSRREPAEERALPMTLAALFLVSGFAALIYQIVWQRALFAAFGVDPESVTVIVSVFMLGLGIGALAGGLFSTRWPRRLPHAFLVCEVATGAFGVVSIPLIQRVGDAGLHASLAQLTLAVFVLLLVPTMLMGATLPILVAFLHQTHRRLGRAVGLLYAVNTLGSALASFFTTEVLFVFIGQQGAVLVAAACNFAVGFAVFHALPTGRGAGRAEPEAAGRPPVESGGRGGRRMAVALAISAAVGFVSLSQEMLWIRLLAYAGGSRAEVFGRVLGMFLVGVAAGAYALPRLVERLRIPPLSLVAAAIFGSGTVYFLALPVCARWMTTSPFLGMVAAHLAVAVVAGLSGGIFPVLCDHAAGTGPAVGMRTAWLYMANIAGSTAGPLVTGFWLLDVFTLDRLVLWASVGMLALTLPVWLLDPRSTLRLASAAASLAVAVGAVVAHDRLYAHLLERLHFKAGYTAKRPYRHVASGRGGIVAVWPDAAGDIVFGASVYDGRFNVDPVVDSNGIRRAYATALLHAGPSDVLEIGVSSASGTAAILSDPRVRRLTAVELNPAYLEVIRHYPAQAAALQDPRLELVFDDGRRWLRRHPGRRFDVIAMNSMIYWRSLATTLLSREFLEICREHLKPGGVLYYNTTGFEGSFHTAARVFRHVTRVDSFVAASDSPIGVGPEARRDLLLSLRMGGAPVFEPTSPASRTALEAMLAFDLSDLGPAYRARRDLPFITDDNMAPEFKANPPLWPDLVSPQRSWRALLERRRGPSPPPT